MTLREEREFRRYCPVFRRISGVVMVAILFPCLTSLDLVAQDQLGKAVAKEMRARSEHERLRETVPQYLRSDLLPRVRALSAKLDGVKPDDFAGFRPEVEQLRSDIRRLRLALLDRFSREKAEASARASATDANEHSRPASAGQERRAAFDKSILELVNSLDTYSRLLLSSDVRRHSAAVTRLGQLATSAAGTPAGSLPNADANRPGRSPNPPLGQAAPQLPPSLDSRHNDAPSALSSLTLGQSVSSEFSHSLDQRASGSARFGVRVYAEADTGRSGGKPSLRRAPGPRPASLSFSPSGTLLDLSGIPVPSRSLAALGDVLWSPLQQVTDPLDSGVPTASDLAVSAPQTSSSAAVQALADELQTPVKIFEHFRNGFVYEPYFGAVKGADQTLAETAGNDADLASALISVFRAAGVPCRYVYGTIRLTAAQAASWLGVDTDQVEGLLAASSIPYSIDGTPGTGDVLVDHVWVKAYVDYLPYRGAAAVKDSAEPENTGDSWIEIDPSFKQHSFSERRNLEADLGVNSSAFLTNIRAQSTLGAIPANTGLANASGSDTCDDNATALPQSYILNEIIGLANPLVDLMGRQNLTLDTVFRKRVIDGEAYGLLPCTDLYSIQARGAAWNTFPEALSASVSLTMQDTAGREILSCDTPVAALLDADLSLNYAPATQTDSDILADWTASGSTDPFPAYLVNVTSQLELDGTVLAAGADASPLGALQKLTWRLRPAGTDSAVFPDADLSRVTTAVDTITAGSRADFIFDAGRITDEQISEAHDVLSGTAPPISSLLRAVGLNYFYQSDRFAQITAGVLNQYACRTPSIIRVSYSLNVEDLFDLPYTVSSKSIKASVVHDAFTASPISSSSGLSSAFTHINALLSSALGCNALQQSLDDTAISTARLEQIGSSVSVPVLTLAPETDANGSPTGTLDDTVFDGLNVSLSPASCETILAFLNLGYSVTFPRDPVTYGGLTRDPLLAVDPITGDTGLFLIASGYADNLNAGSEVLLTDGALSVPDLLDSATATVPAVLSSSAAEWLSTLSDATISTGISYVPAIAHIKNFLIDDGGTGGTSSPGGVLGAEPLTLSLSSLKSTAAAIALIGRIDQISQQPAIINVESGPQTFSPNGDSVKDTFDLSATTPRTSSWSLRFTDSEGNEVRTLTPADNLAPDTGSAALVNIAWDGTDAGSALLADGRYDYVLTAAGSGSASLSHFAVIDTTAPEAALSLTETAGTGGTVLRFRGTADDANLESYSLDILASATGDLVSTAATGNLAVLDSIIATVSSTDLANGSYTARLTVTDSAGNSTVAETAAPFTVDNPPVDETAPQVSITSAVLDPDAGVLNGLVPITVSAFDEVGVVAIELLIDSNVVAGTASGVTTLAYSLDCTAFADGVHTVQATACDAAGNEAVTDETTFLTSQAVDDRIAPSASITMPDVSQPLTGAVPVTVDATDNEEVDRIDLLLDGSVIATEDPTPDGPSLSLSTSIDTGAITEGAHTLVARVTDAAGNIASVGPITFTSYSSSGDDVTPPDVTLAMPSATGDLTGDVTVTATASDNVGVQLLQIVLDGVVAASVLNPSPAELSYVIHTAALTEGTHTIYASAADAADNTSVSPTGSFTTSQTAGDTVSPVMSVGFPDRSTTLTGLIPVTVEASDNVGITQIQLLVDGSPVDTENYAAGTLSITLASSIDASTLTDGTHIFVATASDAAGHVVQTADIEFTSSQTAADTMAPAFTAAIGSALSFDSRDTGTYYHIPDDLTGDIAVSISGTDNIALGRIRLYLDDVLTSSLSVPADTREAVLDSTLAAADLLDGIHTLRIEVADAAGNDAPVHVVTFRSANDSTAPTVTLQTSITDTAQHRGDVSVRVSASDDQVVSQILIRLDGVTVASVNSPDPAELNHVIPAETLIDGAHTITATALDAAGNSGSAPDVAFTSYNPISGFSVSPDYVDETSGTEITVSAKLQQAADWELTFSGPDAITPVTGTGQILSETVDLAGKQDGSYTVTLRVDGVSDTPECSFTVNLVSGPPTAEISNFSEDKADDGSTLAHRVETGFLALTGTADDPDPEDTVKWKVELFKPDGTFVSDVTPDPETDGWNSSRVSDDALGSLDFTLTRNGIYDLTLTVQGGPETRSDTVRIALDSQLKVGQFGFSQQDLIIPVSGMPLSVIRTYNSLNVDYSKDFGAGWTYAISDIEMELDEDRGTSYDEAGDPFSRRYGGGRNVTLTLPGGQRTTFTYRLRPGGSFYYYAEWEAAPGTYATLEPLCENRLTVIPLLDPYWEAAGPETPMEAFEFPGFILTMKDGTKYRIDREDTGTFFEFDDWTGESAFIQTYGEGTLTKIEDRIGNETVFRSDRSGIDSYNAAGEKTKSVEFERDAQGRITAVRDPRNIDLYGLTGPAQVTYEYDASGNLSKVNKLTDDTDPADPVYETVEYKYEEPSRPHFITSIVDPRGITPMQTEYDENGRIIATVDAYGNRIELDHDLSGRSETIFDRQGNPTIHTYDDNGNVTATIDAQGNRTTRTYDSLNNETSVTDPLGNTTHYTYDSKGNRTSVTDPLGNTTNYTYDSYGNQLSVTDPLGNTSTSEYDADGNLISTTNALGQTTTQSYDSDGNLAATYDALGNLTASFGYDGDGNMNSTTDPNGVTRSFGYDTNGNQTGTSFEWVNPNDATDVRNVITQTIYNASGQVIQSIDPQGNSSTTEYNALGKPEVTTDKLGNESVTLYDARGNVIQTLSVPVDPTVPATVSRTVYDANGRAVVSVSRASVDDPAAVPDTITFDTGSRTVYDSIGRTVRSEQLEDVKITLIDHGDGTYASSFTGAAAVLSSTSTTYDAAGRVLESTSATGAVTRYEYDAAGRQTAVIDTFGNRTETDYDAAGRQIAATDALGRTTEFEYDILGRRTRTLFADGTSVQTTYDTLGRRIAETDQAGTTKNFEYEPHSGRLLAVVLPEVEDPENGNVLTSPRYEYDYDIYGRLSTIRDPKGRETKFTYDEFGRQLSRELPLGQLESQVYNTLGQLETKTDFKGQITEFVYDTVGRLSDRYLYPVGAAQADRRIRFVYDALGRQTQIIEGSGESVTPRPPEAVDRLTETTYDDFGRVTTIAGPEGTVNYEYDDFGRKTRTYTANSDISYGYDELGRLSTVTDNSGATPDVTTYSYTDVGSRESQILPNGVTTLYSYDSLNRLTNLSHYNSADELLADYTYTLRADGRRTGVEEETRQPDNTLATRTVVTYDYDALNRLTQECSVSDQAERTFTTDYTYDLVGNRLEKATDNNADGLAEAISYTFNDGDQLVTETSSLTATGQTVYGYDTNGSLISKQNSTTGESCTYGYNLENRLASATIQRTDKDTEDTSHDVAISAAYEYNQSGIRTKAVSSTTVDAGTPYDTTRIFLNDPMNHTGYSQVLEELPTLGGTPVKSYIIGDDVLADTGNYLLYDGHGSTRLLADSGGSITERLSYDAYGIMLGGQPNVTSPVNTDLTYSGEQFDAELGWGYNRARYYNMQAGIWNRVDDYSGDNQDPQSLHKYAYCHDNPANGIDPSGEFTLNQMMAVAGIVLNLGMLVVNVMGYQKNRARAETARWQAWALLAVGQWRSAVGYLLMSWVYGVLAGINFVGAIASVVGIGAGVIALTASGAAQMLSGMSEAATAIAAGQMATVNGASIAAASGGGAIAIGVAVADVAVAVQAHALLIAALATLASILGEISGGGSWDPYSPGEPGTEGGCDEVAEEIQAQIGGKIFKIEPKVDPKLPEFMGRGMGWDYHKVVVKDGMVYDLFTGSNGMTIQAYKAQWAYPEAIHFGF